MRRSIWILVAALLIGAAGIVLVTGHGKRTNAERANEPGDTVSRTLDSKGSTSPRRKPLAAEEALRQFESLLAQWESDQRAWQDEKFNSLLETINALAVENLERLFHEWVRTEESTLSFRQLLRHVVRRWAEQDPQAAWASVHIRFFAEFQRPLLEISREAAECFRAALGGWSRFDPAAAFEMFVTHREEAPRVAGYTVFDYLDQLPMELLFNFAEADPERAWEALKSLSSSKEVWHASNGYYAALPERWDWAMAAERFPSSAPDGSWIYAGDTFPAGMLAKRWVQTDPDAAMNWYVNLPVRNSRGEGMERERLNRTTDLLTSLYREQPRTAMNWLRARREDTDNFDPVATRFLSLATGRAAVIEVLPMVQSEEARYAYMKERASPLDPRSFGRAHMIGFMNWHPEDLAAALAIADLTPEHAAEIQWVVDNGSHNGALLPSVNVQLTIDR